MGRKKISIKPIAHPSTRRATFEKRRIGLLKKAMELSILCKSAVSLTIYTEEGDVFVYASEPYENIMHKFQNYRGPYRLLTNDHLDKLVPGKSSSTAIGYEIIKQSSTSNNKQNVHVQNLSTPTNAPVPVNVTSRMLMPNINSVITNNNIVKKEVVVNGNFPTHSPIITPSISHSQSMNNTNTSTTPNTNDEIGYNGNSMDMYHGRSRSLSSTTLGVNNLNIHHMNSQHQDHFMQPPNHMMIEPKSSSFIVSGTGSSSNTCTQSTSRDYKYIGKRRTWTEMSEDLEFDVDETKHIHMNAAYHSLLTDHDSIEMNLEPPDIDFGHTLF